MVGKCFLALVILLPGFFGHHHAQAAKKGLSFSDKILGRLLKRNEGNLVFSPLAAKVNLSLLLLATRGVGLKEAEELLGWNPGEACSMVPGILKGLKEAFDARDEVERLRKFYHLKRSFSLWGAVEKAVNSSFSLDLKNRLIYPDQAMVGNVSKDFLKKFNLYWGGEMRPGPVVGLFGTARKGKRSKGGGSSRKLKNAARIKLETSLIFRVPWKYPFNPSYTKKGKFWRVSDNGSLSMVLGPMMHLISGRARKDKDMKEFEGNYNVEMLFTEDALAQALLIPTMSSKLEVVLIVPKMRNGILQVMKEIKKIGFSRFLDRYRFNRKIFYRVDLVLPKFHLSWKKRMNPILKDLGLQAVFDGTESEVLEGLFPWTGGFVEEVGHEARLAVDEKGISGGGKSFFLASVGSSPPKPVYADHPFLLVVRVQGIRPPLMVARVMDPFKN